jgi:hypothetical protein
MLSGHAKEKAVIKAKGKGPFIEYQVPRFPLYDDFNRPLIAPIDTRTSFKAFRNYRLPRQLVAFQKRFRLLELPLPEIRSEFDRQTSNAGMLQSRMPHLALKRKILGPSRTSLLWLIFSPVAFVFSSEIPVVDLAGVARC